MHINTCMYTPFTQSKIHVFNGKTISNTYLISSPFQIARFNKADNKWIMCLKVCSVVCFALFVLKCPCVNEQSPDNLETFCNTFNENTLIQTYLRILKSDNQWGESQRVVSVVE